MRKIIAAINMTLDAYCDHTAMSPDEEIHQHYADLLNSTDTILYGRVTFQLMKYWQDVLKNPTGKKSIDEFAVSIDKINKIVFSHTLKNVEWDSARLANRTPKEEIIELQKISGKDILVGSPGLIISLIKLNLIDEFQLCIHPVLVGHGLPLFKDIKDRVQLKLLRTKTFNSGAVMLYYEPVKTKWEFKEALNSWNELKHNLFLWSL